MTNKKWTPPKGWRWMLGMAFQWASSGKTCRVLETKGATTTYAEAEWDNDWRSYVFHGISPLGICPDLTDPATLGCLMALVREAWDASASIVRRDEGWTLETWNTDNFLPDWPLDGTYPTEAEALLAALEATPC